ncbi:thiosulfate/3-mercaptopyruvate sulfurtransferase (plasmid) [Ketogulonicigenium robustum]|uniref:Thiosulfate/3-mercaptopyruvate sulfurtransferase n=1 Tax=Ketogulonicigenium robustum TaxID=92947 RepID=A0A1W6P337_9RHOB|nr:sulfurtransferase [Ketogulonicigenium robustum]ARO15928.1 thiosulfate/3-mercaptopyruvate sulfurtransferase [Ketogulonicigenium robustum]
MSDPLVTPAWLAEHLADVVVLDATYLMPADADAAKQAYLDSHLPGAQFFPIDDIADKTSDLPHMMPDAATFGAAMAALGIDGQKPVVVYDRSPNHFSAPRVWFTLTAYGVPDVFVLDGGLLAWTAQNLPLESGDVTAATVAARDWVLGSGRVLSGPQMADVVAAGTRAIIDARGAARFKGEVAEPRPGLQSGHMPGATNVPFDTLTAPDGRFASAKTLDALLAGKAGDDTVLSCGSGMTAATLALGLARIGKQGSVYDGSWTEWGRGTLGPITKGD